MTGPAFLDLAEDLHVHSTFSDDAHSTIAENLLAATEAGLRSVRLIDHVRATTTWVPDYLAEVAAVPRPPGLRVHTGVETKLLDRAGHLDVPPAAVVPGALDALVIGDHQFPGPEGPRSPDDVRAHLAGGGSTREVLSDYLEATLATMVAHPGAQLAHWFSLLPKIGLAEEDLSTDQLAAWASTAARHRIVVEMNEKWRCPSPRTLRMAFDHGVHVVAATDSHRADEVGAYRWVRTAARAIDGLRIREPVHGG